MRSTIVDPTVSGTGIAVGDGVTCGVRVEVLVVVTVFVVDGDGVFERVGV